MRPLIRKIFFYLVVFISLFYAILQLVRVYKYDYFEINGYSMFPTLYDGDVVVVDKSIFGARVYDGVGELTKHLPATYRHIAERAIEYNDIVIVNNPRTQQSRIISFGIGDVLSKRVVGLAGDTITVAEGYYINSSCDESVGYLAEQDYVNRVCFRNSATSDSLGAKWNHKALYIPKQGDNIVLDSSNMQHYQGLINYETGKTISEIIELKSYRFKNNYYYVVGDNFTKSLDSRHFGILPETYIVGVVDMILYSRNRTLRVFRKDRFWLSVDEF